MSGENRQESEGLTPRQLRYLSALLTTPRLDDAAKKAGVSVRQAREWRNRPAFRDALREARAGLLQDTTTAATGAMLEAVAVMWDMMGNADTPPSVRLAAARSLAELGPRLIEANDVNERLTRLEEKTGL